MATKTVSLVALDSIDHDGVRYELGEKLTCTEAQAKALVDAKVAATPREAREALAKGEGEAEG